MDELTEAEKEDLHRRIHESEATRREFEELKKTWELSGQYRKNQNRDKSTAWQNILEHTTQEQRRSAASTRIRKLRTRPYLQIAASILVLVVLGFLAGNQVKKSQFSAEGAATYATGDSLQVIRLSDGTRVWLNRNSTLSLHRRFNQKERRVLLSGEAFFEVKRDSLKAFMVLAGNATTRVLGTSFLVEEMENEMVRVSVETGKVAFYRRKNRSVEVLPGYSALLTEGSNTPAVTGNRDTNYLAWKTHTLVFSDTPLEQVVHDLEEYYRVDIQTSLKDPAKYELTARFTSEDLEAVLELISFTLELQYRWKDDGSIEILEVE